MSKPGSDPLESLTRRVTALEEAVAYSERTIDDLDHALRDFHQRLDTLEKRLSHLAQQLGVVAETAEGGKPKGG